MVNWKDPDLEAKLETLSAQLLYAILGLYGWEYICSSHVEIALLRRKLPFRWPLLSYIVARFSFLIATVLFAAQFSPFHTIIDCQSMNLITIFATNAAIGCSTTNLMIRTWLIWKTSYLLRLLLVLLSLGHWTMLTLFLVTTHASTRNGVCIISFVKPAYTSAVIIYSMLYDLALLVFTVIGLLRMPSSSTLWKMLLKQGVIYFILNLVAKVILLTVNLLNLSRKTISLHCKRIFTLYRQLPWIIYSQCLWHASARLHLAKWSLRSSVLRPLSKATVPRRLKCLR